MIIYDIETIRPVRPRDPAELLPGIEYADHWQDYRTMSIACICAYDYQADRFRVFGSYEGAGLSFTDNSPANSTCDLERFAAFAANRTLIGWNNRFFDDRLLAAHGVDVVESWDIKAALMQAGCGGQRGNSLDAFAAANLTGAGKSMAGDMAPVWWQRGQRERVIDYCLQDVNLTRRLLDRLLHKGELVSPLDGRPIRPPIPATIQHMHHQATAELQPCAA
jgi:hypothetical protein